MFSVKSVSMTLFLEKHCLLIQFPFQDEIDETTPILGKIGELGDRYWTWIHQPYEGTLRLFESDFLEMLTRTAWWVVPLVWMPLVLYFALSGLNMYCRDYGRLLFHDKDKQLVFR